MKWLCAIIAWIATTGLHHAVLAAEEPSAGTERSGIREKEISLAARYLLFPIQNGGRQARIDLKIDGRNVREFDAEIAESKDKVSFWAFLDITPFKGQLATLRVEGSTPEGMEMIVPSEEIPGSEAFYNEPLRPQFHFSQKIGWIQDPNGLVYHDGEWHLYFQHNPYGWNNANMQWGHAVSTDLLHWEQLPVALYNRQRGDWAFSGHAVVDEKNTGGWQTGSEKVIVASWTSSERGQCISFSNDRGRTFQEYEGNPVLPDPSARDPKILWYEPGRHWVMVVFEKHGGPHMAFYTSTNLKEWQIQSRLMDWSVCPELVELPVDGDHHNKRWVVFAFDASYAVGKFDGKTFTPSHDGKHKLHYGMQKEKPLFCYRASQVFNNAPDGRAIQLGWAKIWMPGMPFNQAFSFPHELTLRTTDEGVRMFAEPVKEIANLSRQRHAVEDRPLTEGAPVTLDAAGDLFDVTATFEPGNARVLGIEIGGNRIEYNVGSGMLQDAPLRPVGGRVAIRALIDRPTIEVIGNHGRVVITNHRESKGSVKTVQAYALGGSARLVKAEVHELASIWKQ